MYLMKFCNNNNNNNNNKNIKDKKLSMAEKELYRVTVKVYFPEHCRLTISCEQCYFCREAGYTNIAQRLIEVQFELTDRLTYYLCGRRPGKCFFLL